MFMLGGSVADHYRDLLDERRNNPCVEEPQADPARVQSADHAQTIGSATLTSSSVISQASEKEER